MEQDRERITRDRERGIYIERDRDIYIVPDVRALLAVGVSLVHVAGPGAVIVLEESLAATGRDLHLVTRLGRVHLAAGPPIRLRKVQGRLSTAALQLKTETRIRSGT